jgi:hypothetical protein
MLAMAVMLCAGSAMAVDHIGVYSDNVNMDQCYLSNPLPAFPNVITLYIVHKFADLHGGTSGSQFKVVDGSGLFFNGAAAIAPFLTIGNYNTDWTIAYASCKNVGALPIATLSYFATAVPAACAQILIAPAPSAISGQIEAIDCNDVSAIATGGSFHFSPDGSCSDCDEPHPNAAKTSTWGNIKSLYR